MVLVKTMDIILDLSGEIWKIVSFFSVSVSLCLLAKDAYVNLQNFVAGGNTWVTNTMLYHTLPRRLVKGRQIYALYKMIIWNFDPWKSQRISVSFGGLAKYVQDCDQTKTSHLQSCLLTCFSLNPQKKRDYMVTMFFFQGFCQCRWATNLFVL